MDRDQQESTGTQRKLDRRTFVLAPGLATLAGGLPNTGAGAAAQTASPEATPVVSTGAPAWLSTVEDLVRIEPGRERRQQ